MRTRARDIRCKACSTLLCREEPDGLTLVRGGLQATVTGQYHLSLVCYRPGCRTLNVVTPGRGTPEPHARMAS